MYTIYVLFEMAQEHFFFYQIGVLGLTNCLVILKVVFLLVCCKNTYRNKLCLKLIFNRVDVFLLKQVNVFAFVFEFFFKLDIIIWEYFSSIGHTSACCGKEINFLEVCLELGIFRAFPILNEKLISRFCAPNNR